MSIATPDFSQPSWAIADDREHKTTDRPAGATGKTNNLLGSCAALVQDSCVTRHRDIYTYVKRQPPPPTRPCRWRGNRVESDRKWVEIPVPLPTPMSPSRFLLVQTARSWGGVECHKQLGVGPGKPFVATQVEAPPVRLNEVASLHGLVKDSLFTLGRAGNGRRAWTVATLFLSKSKAFLCLMSRPPFAD